MMKFYKQLLLAGLVTKMKIILFTILFSLPAFANNCDQALDQLLTSTPPRVNTQGQQIQGYRDILQGRNINSADDLQDALIQVNRRFFQLNGSNPTSFLNLSAADRLRRLDLLEAELRNINPALANSPEILAYRTRMQALAAQEVQDAATLARATERIEPTGPRVSPRDRASGVTEADVIAAGGQVRRPGIVSRLFGGRRAPPPAAAPWTDETRQAALQNYTQNRREVLDPDGVSPDAALASTLQVEELYNPRIRGSVHDMFRTDRFRTTGPRETSDYWWRQRIVAGQDSFPLRQFNSVDDLSNVRRVMHWPARRVNSSEWAADLSTYRAVVNQRKNANGQWVDETMEVIARDRNGNWEPVYYVRQNDRWVQSRTAGGVPVRQACAQCHTRNGRFSPLPAQLSPHTSVRMPNAPAGVTYDPYRIYEPGQFGQFQGAFAP
jgi:hypothetical protein